MFNFGYFIIFGAVILNVIGQIGFKYIANFIKDRGLQGLLDLQFVMIVLVVCIAYGSAVVLWIIALTKVPLSTSYSVFALSFLLVPLAGVVLFNEKTNIFAIMVSFSFILFGILIVNLVK